MQKYQLLSHVADVRLLVCGDTLEELFSSALEGMGELLKPGICVEEGVLKEKLELSSLDSTSLLIDFLSEVLALSHINRAVYCKIKFIELAPTSLKATIFGKPTEEFSEDIKAVTFHEAEIKKSEAGHLETIIIFDI